jgi:glycosyltransferase involved in cell wall biosynthesis
MGDFVAGVAPSVLALRTVKPDLVYVNTITLPLWLAMAKIVRCPIVCHIHEAESSAPGWLLRALNLPLFLADRLIANSEFSRGVVARVYAPLAKRVKVIRNAVPGPSEVTPAREVLESPYQLLYVGRLSPRKGAHVALAAIALLRARDIPVRLDIVGAVFPGYEWYEQQLREYVEDKQLGNVVRWHGFQADIWEYVARADVVVVPSTVDEPFGNTAVEAALGARPLVVSDLAGLKEAVNGVSAAVRVPPLSPGAMADAVEQICSNWTLYRLRAAEDCVFASYRYSTGTYAEQLLHVLSELRG